MKKNLKYALQASGFVALFALSLSNLQAAEPAVKDAAPTTENHESTAPKHKKEHKREHKNKDNHAKERSHHMEKRAASEKFALEKWEKSSHSLKAELAASKAAPVAASELAKIQGDDAQLSAIYNIVSNGKALSKADRELVKEALIPLTAYANKLSSQMRELLMEMRENKFLEKDDLRAVYKSLFEGSFQDFEHDYLRNHDKKNDGKKHAEKHQKGKKLDDDKKHEKKNHKNKKHAEKHDDKNDDKNDDEKNEHKKRGNKKHDGKRKKHDGKKKHKDANKAGEHKEEHNDDAK